MNISTPNSLPTPEPVVELERLGDEIAERDGWNTGFLSCAHWLSWRVGLDRGAARERVRVARALGALPQLAQALARGELSYSKVRALTRVATAGRKNDSSPLAGPAPPSTSSTSSAAGAGWIARQKRRRRC